MSRTIPERSPEGRLLFYWTNVLIELSEFADSTAKIMSEAALDCDGGRYDEAFQRLEKAHQDVGELSHHFFDSMENLISGAMGSVSTATRSHKEGK